MENEVDVWIDSEWVPAKVLDTNQGLSYVEFDNGRTDWVADFEVERRDG